MTVHHNPFRTANIDQLFIQPDTFAFSKILDFAIDMVYQLPFGFCSRPNTDNVLPFRYGVQSDANHTISGGSTSNMFL